MEGKNLAMAEAQIDIRCPGCGARYWVDEGRLGSEAECGVCKRGFVLAADSPGRAEQHESQARKDAAGLWARRRLGDR